MGTKYRSCRWYSQLARETKFNGGLTALLRQMGTGLLVTDVMGQGVNIVTGIILVAQPVSGWKMARSISGCRNYHCRSITRYVEKYCGSADDVEHRSNIQTGSILLDKMKISGN